MRRGIAIAAAGLFAVCICLVPVGESKEASKGFSCLSNVKQLAVGLGMYAADSDGRFAPSGSWTNAAIHYLKHCPGYEEEYLKCPNVPKGSFGYAFNASLSSAREPKDADVVPLVYESTNPARNASDLFTSLPRPVRHKGKNNVGYADGHARSLEP